VKREVTVVVAGHVLHVRSDEELEYVIALGAYVDGKIREIGRGQEGVTTLNLALTAALAIADEVQKLRRSQDGIDGKLDQLAAEIEAVLDAGEEIMQ